MKWNTRVTELLGCKYPILQGAYAGFGTWQFAAAVAKTGAFGCITASVSQTPEQLTKDVASCREVAGNSFSVNLSIGRCPHIEEMAEVCIEEKVPIETSVYRPDSIVPRIKGRGVPWIHKTARVKDALYAEAMGADAVIVVGLEGVGFKNPMQLPTMTNITWGAKQFNVPFIAAGGIGDAHGLLGALAMGADGIMMGTAFMTIKECPIDEKVIEAIVDSSPDTPQVRNRVLAGPDPKEYAEAMAKKDQMPLNEWLALLRRIQRKASGMADSDDAQPSRLGSLAVGVIDHITTAEELVSGIVREAEELVKKWYWLR
jgi:NAD(P)H-dependent flavin oxidoreductase YrpB (nitropropane dioxygenase family)